MRRLSVNIALLFGSILVSLLLIEAALRLFSPLEIRVRGDRIDLPYFKRYEMDYPDARKLDRHIVHARNALGFRGPNPPRDLAERLSLLAVGGSTTECFYVSDGKTWPELVGRNLSPFFPDSWINNAGLSGHSTHGHLRLMEQHVLALKPKVVLFLVGINDRARGESNRHDQTIELDDDRPMARMKRTILANSEVLSLLWSLHRTWKATELGVTGKEVDFATLGEPAVPDEAREAELTLHRSHQGAYGDRLERLLDLAQGGGIVPVLMTQPAVYGPAIDDATGRDLGRIEAEPLNGAVAWEVLELYNGTTRAVAARRGVLLIDLAAELPKSTRLYRDHIHFSNEGSAAVAGIIAARLCPFLARRFPDQAKTPCPDGEPGR